MLIPDWKSSWKFLSVLSALILALAAEAAPYWPELKEALPEHWVSIGLGVLVVARLIDQKKVGGALRMFLEKLPPSVPPTMLLLLPLMGCGGSDGYVPATPGTPRGDCYTEAEEWGKEETRKKCGDAGSTSECTAYPAIEAEVTKRQEACP